MHRSECSDPKFYVKNEFYGHENLYFDIQYVDPKLILQLEVCRSERFNLIFALNLAQIEVKMFSSYSPSKIRVATYHTSIVSYMHYLIIQTFGMKNIFVLIFYGVGDENIFTSIWAFLRSNIRSKHSDRHTTSCKKSFGTT